MPDLPALPYLPYEIVAAVAVGLLLLLLGKRLFWLFVAGVGFIVVFRFASQGLNMEPGWAVLAMAGVAGLVGALLAIWVQWVAVAVGGFLAGGHGLVRLVELTGFRFDLDPLVLFLAGGVLGAVLLIALFNPALVLLSSVVGAALIVDTLQLPETESLVVFGALVLVGVVVQSRVETDKDD